MGLSLNPSRASVGRPASQALAVLPQHCYEPRRQMAALMIEQGQKIHSRLARWSGRLALFSAGLTVTGVVLHRLTSFPTPVAINLFAASAVGLALAILLGLLSLIGIWRKGYAGAGTAFLGIFLPLLILVWPLTFVPALFKLPRLND